MAKAQQPQEDKPSSDTVGGRMLEARMRAGLRYRQTISRTRMAELVGEELGRELYEQQWRRYESGLSEPPLDVIAATARVSELSPEYIAFGRGALAREPDLVAQAKLLTDEQLDRADRAAVVSDAKHGPDRKSPRRASGKRRS